MNRNISEPRPAGYAYLLDLIGQEGMSHWHTSLISSSGTRRTKIEDGSTEETYPAKYWPGEQIGDHLEFALKYDGVHLSLLAQIFEKVSPDELANFVRSKPTGKYTRRIWFFYEFLTGKQLPLDNLTSGNYIDALETKDYYTVPDGERSLRHRVVNNLLGPKTFCPIVRKTKKLAQLDAHELRNRCQELISTYPPKLLRRALSYLYNKEARSSFEIEGINPATSLRERWYPWHSRLIDPFFSSGRFYLLGAIEFFPISGS